jgi:hypothetical protein
MAIVHDQVCVYVLGRNLVHATAALAQSSLSDFAAK